MPSPSEPAVLPRCKTTPNGAGPWATKATLIRGRIYTLALDNSLSIVRDLSEAESETRYNLSLPEMRPQIMGA